ncbi:PepSY-associated TM helix domain-containing protein [Chitinasiproducens palmae]|uniref:Peptidase propeptide and YPEB domain-containing protein n=1 Tax=Chitinasiproducens palmae TaxID=1770053 RepID=A0A1H2PV79_9BURK|nr:PepSY domain-containing protein [Chitinasiproducens palmae]SDV51192.1 Peptidase propeptide and YPEB domain-containing protein [Chitinasiproducens palmae]
MTAPLSDSSGRLPRPVRPVGRPDDSPARYRTLWRWHFYAGLFVMPLLIVLALTGTLYCFQPQIEPLLYPSLLRVDPAGTPLARQTLLARARDAMPAGAVATTATIRTDARSSAEFVFRRPDGESDSVYVDPYSGQILGTLSVEHRLMRQARLLHRALLLGKPGELVMELAACWTLVMLGTGLALWWPRLRQTGARAWLPERAATRRNWWKSLHGALGAWLAIGGLAFVLTGMPWTGSWGQQFKALVTRAGLGEAAGASHVHGDAPAGAAHAGHAAASGTDAAAMSGSRHGGPEGQGGHEGHGGHSAAAMHGRNESHAADGEQERLPQPGQVANGAPQPPTRVDQLPVELTPWAAGLAAIPTGSSATPAQRLPLDRVVAIAAREGVVTGYDVALPTTPDGVYTVSYYPPDPQGERILNIDARSGAIVKDLGYRQYGAVAKAVAYGTSLHMGRYFGLANQIACAAISLGLLGLAVTGLLMWLKRRPRGRLAAPSRPLTAATMRAWVIGLACVGLVFPMMGASLLLVWCVDRLAGRRLLSASAGR